MRKTGFTIVEVVIVFLLILGITFFILPKSLDSTKQARFISQWSTKYSDLEYMVSVIKAQKDNQIKKEFKNAQNNTERKLIILDTIKPYLRITSELKSTDYKQHYMNGSLVDVTDKYYFKNFYLTHSGGLIGLKMGGEKCSDENICATMVFDLNGIKKPNSWGYDVFGVNVINDRIEPLGKDATPDELRANCSKVGYGVYCSYYYLIGGRFD